MTTSDTPNMAQSADKPLNGHIVPAPRILVVDPDTDIRRLYAEVLSGTGYEVDLVPNAATGWKALRAKRYHLVITEHELPDLTGTELIKNLRSARIDVPVVLAAASFPMRDLMRNPSLQLAATLLKPFGMDTLLHAVKSALNGTSAGPDDLSGVFRKASD